jgi:hypothetical protein
MARCSRGPGAEDPPVRRPQGGIDGETELLEREQKLNCAYDGITVDRLTQEMAGGEELDGLAAEVGANCGNRTGSPCGRANFVESKDALDEAGRVFFGYPVSSSGTMPPLSASQRRSHPACSDFFTGASMGRVSPR